MKPTNIAAPDYFHKVVDCQWACPAHTPVPEYIRLIAEGRYSDAYMINWKSNVFPGILGRTCDRPCEPACRRGRVEETPVAICRLKRVAADYKDDIRGRLPKPAPKNGKRIALVGGGPASLTVARDLAPLGYHCIVFDDDPKAGGMMRTQIPKFRLPDSVIDEETDYILDLGIEFNGGTAHRQPEEAAVGELRRDLRRLRRAARPRTRHSRPQGSGQEHPHRHRLAVQRLVRPRRQDRQARHRARRRQHRDGLLPLRAPARRRGRQGDRALRLRGDEGVAPGRKEDAMHEDIPILNFLVPKAFTHDNGKLTGMVFEKVKAEYDAKGRRNLVPTGEPDQTLRLRRRAGRGRPGERLPLDRARHRHRVRQVGHAQGRHDDHGLDQSEGVLRRRRGLRPEEHHLGGGAWPRRRAVDPQVLLRRGHHRAPAARRADLVAEDGHPRMELRQRHLDRQALPGAASRQGRSR